MPIQDQAHHYDGPGRETPTILDVVALDQCIGCGACIEACPYRVVEPSYSAARGAHEVAVADTSNCSQCPKPCDVVCPSQTIDFTNLLGPDAGPLGPVRDVFLARSPDFCNDGVSSSGGVLRALVREALEAGTPVVCLADHGAREKMQRLTRPTDLARMPGSVYHSVSFVGVIDLIRSASEPVAVVATPCQLAGLTKFIRFQEPALENRIALKLGLICGWMFCDHAISAFACYHGLGRSWDKARYRGEDQVGRLKIEIEGKAHIFKRRDHHGFYDRNTYAAAFSSNLNRMRCLLCEDHLNVLADVAVGDAWLERTAGQKLSVVVARTERGSSALAAAQRRGRLELMQSAGEPDLIESQSDRLIHGWGAKTMAAVLNARGITTPRFIYATGKQKPLPEDKGSQIGAYNSFLFDLVRAGWYWAYLGLYIARNVWRSLASKLEPR